MTSPLLPANSRCWVVIDYQSSWYFRMCSSSLENLNNIILGLVKTYCYHGESTSSYTSYTSYALGYHLGSRVLTHNHNIYIYIYGLSENNQFWWTIIIFPFQNGYAHGILCVSPIFSHKNKKGDIIIHQKNWRHIPYFHLVSNSKMVQIAKKSPLFLGEMPHFFVPRPPRHGRLAMLRGPGGQGFVAGGHTRWPESSWWMWFSGCWARATPLKNRSSSIGMISNPILMGK